MMSKLILCVSTASSHVNTYIPQDTDQGVWVTAILD